jgi:hypothetical protein
MQLLPEPAGGRDLRQKLTGDLRPAERTVARAAWPVVDVGAKKVRHDRHAAEPVAPERGRQRIREPPDDLARRDNHRFMVMASCDGIEPPCFMENR